MGKSITERKQLEEEDNIHNKKWILSQNTGIFLWSHRQIKVTQSLMQHNS